MPTTTLKLSDPKLGTVEIQQWSRLHFRAAALHEVQLLRITVTGKVPHHRCPKPMWLAWLGEQMPELEQVWRYYLRRFAVDHWNRFAIAAVALDTTPVQYVNSGRTLE